jgi:hypothetical protein
VRLRKAVGAKAAARLVTPPAGASVGWWRWRPRGSAGVMHAFGVRGLLVQKTGLSGGSRRRHVARPVAAVALRSQSSTVARSEGLLRLLRSSSHGLARPSPWVAVPRGKVRPATRSRFRIGGRQRGTGPGRLPQLVPCERVAEVPIGRLLLGGSDSAPRRRSGRIGTIGMSPTRSRGARRRNDQAIARTA